VLQHHCSNDIPTFGTGDLSSFSPYLKYQFTDRAVCFLNLREALVEVQNWREVRSSYSQAMNIALRTSQSLCLYSHSIQLIEPHTYTTPAWRPGCSHRFCCNNGTLPAADVRSPKYCNPPCVVAKNLSEMKKSETKEPLTREEYLKMYPLIPDLIEKHFSDKEKIQQALEGKSQADVEVDVEVADDTNENDAAEETTTRAPSAPSVPKVPTASATKRGRVNVVLGAQWGDEGKGKLVDILSGKYAICARVAGGSNAGHTIVVNVRATLLWSDQAMNMLHVKSCAPLCVA
jgi:hypothetical protein